MSNCTDCDYVQVRDFEELRRIYNETIKELETDTLKVIEMIEDLGELLKTQLGLNWPNFNAQQSKYIVDLYDETINLNNTYYQQCTI
jgi:hypothetical protein